VELLNDSEIAELMDNIVMIFDNKLQNGEPFEKDILDQILERVEKNALG
jgi:hypothetical protein